MAPGELPTAGTLFAAFHGELTPHPWRPADCEHDAYQLFHQRSLAMGRLDSLWAMNDAGTEQRPPDEGAFAWFQVEATRSPLPVRAFLVCAGSTLERIGSARVTAVQVRLPALEPTAARLPHTLAALDQHVFALRSHAPGGTAPVGVHGPVLSVRARSGCVVPAWRRAV